MNAPEFDSVIAFITFLQDDERKTYTSLDLTTLVSQSKRNLCDVRKELDSLGFTLETRVPAKRVRGFTTSSNDRWYGPGSDKTHGGSGFDNRE